jgi:hypothetical protein
MLREDPENRTQAARFATLMMDNITKHQHKYIRRKIGLFNRNFVNELGRDIIAVFGENGKRLLNMDYNEFVHEIRQIYDLINQR